MPPKVAACFPVPMPANPSIPLCKIFFFTASPAPLDMISLPNLSTPKTCPFGNVPIALPDITACPWKGDIIAFVKACVPATFCIPKAPPIDWPP